MSKQDSVPVRVLAAVLLIAVAIGASYGLLRAGVPGPCMCQPAPTPVACCNTDHCRQEFAKVDARFGGVWDELVEVQEQLAKVKSCDCGPVKECSCDIPGLKATVSELILNQREELEERKCRCSAKPACECKPVTQPAGTSVNPAPKLQPAPACGRRGRK